ncbi:MAG: SusC/RagA family TonB-linked outer membrane protein [Leadbetterella sp.]
MNRKKNQSFKLLVCFGFLLFMLCIPKISKSNKIRPSTEIISGQVNDGVTNETLIGVSVSIKGTTRGVVTDVNGKYSIEVPSTTSVLVFTYLGYEPQEIEVGSRSSINVSLNLQTQALEEVIVVGFGQVNKRDLTGAVGKVNANKINELPLAGFDQALQGKLSGVRVINSNAAPGGGFDMQIRGVSSLTASSQPLIVIDGMPILYDGYQAENNPLNLINPNDIESVEVLKDASSAAIYGARASGGVILITTKKGKPGKPTLNFNANNGFSQAINIPKVGTREQYLQWTEDMSNYAYYKANPSHYSPSTVTSDWKWNIDNVEDFNKRSANLKNLLDFRNDAQGLNYRAFDPARMAPATQTQILQLIDGTAPWMNTNTDWIDLIQNDGQFPGRIAQYNLSASGGSNNIRYQASGSYYDEKGIVKNTGLKRYTLNLNLDFDVTRWMKVGAKLSPSWQDLDNIGGASVENRWFNSPLYQSAQLMPSILAPYDANGNIADYSNLSPWQTSERAWGGTFYGNPLYLFEQLDNRTTFRTLGNLSSEISFTKNLKFKSSIMTDYSHAQERKHRPSTMGDRFNSPGDQNFGAVVNASNQQGRGFKYYWENTLTYNKVFNKSHNVNAVLSYNQEKTMNDRVFVSKRSFVTDDIDRPAGGVIVQNPVSDATDFANNDAFIGMFSRLQYNYKSKYYITAAIRRDGSSRFGLNTLWGNFPSAALAWRLSDESFMKNLKFIYDLKIRVSYGETGNSGIPRGRQQPIYNNNSYITNNRISQGFVLANLYDTNLSWEKTKEKNFGMDLALLKGKVNITAEYYNRNTTDMLLFLDLPQYVGYGSVLTNFGSMLSRGAELTISATPLTNKTIVWNTEFNISRNAGKITKLFVEPQAHITGQQVSGWNDMTRGYVGGPLSVFWGTVSDGIYNDWNEVNTTPKAYNYSNGVQETIRLRSNAPGEIKYKDVNGDGIINLDDKTVVGNPWPDFTWGFSNTFKYKNFDLFIQMDGIIGAEIFNVTRFEWFRQAQSQFNMPDYWLKDYWTPSNTDAQYPIISNRGGVNNGQYNDLFQGTFIKEDGDFTAVRSIRLGYTLPNKISKSLKMSKLRIYSNIQNAFYFTKYTGFNPEGNNRGLDTNNQGQRSNNYGVDGGNYPIQRIATLGIDLTF